MSGWFKENNYVSNFNENALSMLHNNVPANNKKRRLSNGEMELPSTETISRGRSFLPVRRGLGVYHTDDWKASGTSLFCPVTQDTYINIPKFDQITAAQGSFFTADESGHFSKSLTGDVLHFWRYDKQERKLYISQSFLFTNPQEFQTVQAFLHNV